MAKMIFIDKIIGTYSLFAVKTFQSIKSVVIVSRVGNSKSVYSFVTFISGNRLPTPGMPIYFSPA
jgi:hypothetical protein